MKRQVTALLIIVTAALARPQLPNSQSLVRVGGISAENGVFASKDGLITVYSDQSISAEFGTNPKRQFLDHIGSVTFEVEGESMRRVQNRIPLAFAHEFQFCDSLDQISMPVDRGILLILPKTAKIKSAEDLVNGRQLVIYTVPDVSEHYKIMVSLLQADPAQKYSIAGSDTVTKYGDFCGTQELTVNLRAILVDEPAGSSDSSVVYIYALKPVASTSTKPK